MKYPKMLYKGNTAKYKHAIAQDAEHEEELISQGHVGFDQLEAPECSSGSVSESTPKVNIAGDALELAKITHERDQLKVEVERLNAVIERGSAENITLKQQLDPLSSVADAELAPQAPDLNKYTAEQLREMLTTKGVEFKANNSKATLITLLSDN